jgi:hypothetical protein
MDDDQHFSSFTKLKRGKNPLMKLMYLLPRLAMNMEREVGRYNPKLALTSIFLLELLWGEPKSAHTIINLRWTERAASCYGSQTQWHLDLPHAIVDSQIQLKAIQLPTPFF